METVKGESFATLCFIAEGLKQFKFPDLKRPSNPANAPATIELVGWGTQVYCFSWMRHICRLLNGIVSLESAGNRPSARIVARSTYELGAHIYYLKKHLKQHIDVGNLSAAWKFLTPIAIGSRYISERNCEDSEMFPSPPHISKAIKCFQEKLPKDAQEDYSYLSEFCHPNSLSFLQYYNWSDPNTVTFVDGDPRKGVFGPTTAAALQGLLALDELLRLTKEKTVRRSLRELLVGVAKEAGAYPPATAPVDGQRQ
jgi:hypothetical protein